MIALAIALAVVVGLILGMLGGGGSILTVPLLVYVAGLEPKAAIASSLLVVGVTSAVAALSHAFAGRVRWRTGLIFGGAGMVGAYGGGRLAHFVPGQVLLLAFAVLMIVTSIAMLRGRREPDPSKVAPHLPIGRTVLTGAAVGSIAGLVGAGGGFLVVPALALLGGLAMPTAVGTSLVVISVTSFGGLAGHLPSVQIDWPLAGAVTAAAVAGALVGGRVAGLLSPPALRRVFGVFVLAMGTVILAQETPREWLAPTVVVLLASALVTGVVVLVPRRRRSR